MLQALVGQRALRSTEFQRRQLIKRPQNSKTCIGDLGRMQVKMFKIAQSGKIFKPLVANERIVEFKALSLVIIEIYSRPRSVTFLQERTSSAFRLRRDERLRSP